MLNQVPDPGLRPQDRETVGRIQAEGPHPGELAGALAPRPKLDEEERQRILSLAQRFEALGTPLDSALRADFIARNRGTSTATALLGLGSVGCLIGGAVLTLGALGSGTPSGALPLVLAGLGIVGVVVNSVRVGRVGLQIIGEFNRSLGDAALLHGYHATFASSDYFNAVRCSRDVLSQEAPSFVKIRAIFGLIAVLQKTREPECFGAALEVATDHLLSVMVPARLGSQSVQFACLETIKVVADRMRSTQFDTETNLQGEHPYFSPKNVRGLMTLYRLTSLVRPLASSVLKELPDDLLRRVGPFGIETRVALSELKGAVDSFFPPEPPESAKS